MKRLADAKRTEVTFNVGDWVFVKLHPYKQHSVICRPPKSWHYAILALLR